MPRIMRDGDEYDAYTGARRWHAWRAGQRKAIKQRTHRRERRQGQHLTRTALDEY